MVVPDEPLAQMRRLSMERPDAGQWYAYTNVAMDSATLGDTRYLRCGPGCTLREPPPERHPDIPGPNGLIGWKYVLAGVVDLATGIIERTNGHVQGR